MKTTLSNENLVVTLNTFGAEMISLKKTITKREYIWEGNPEFWGKHSPVLFPIVGALKNNTYKYNEASYEMLRHGFASKSVFKLVSATNNKAIFSLKSNEETKKMYPFIFEFQVCYTLLSSSVKIHYKIINLDNVILPFSIGAHPAFALPNSLGSYSLEFNKQDDLQSFTLENNLISNTIKNIELVNKKLPLDYSLFEKDALIFKEMQSKEIRILENDIPFLKIDFDLFKNLGIWTKNNAPFICIEPWLGYADTVNTTGNIIEKEGIILLEKNKSFETHITIEIL